MLLDDDDLAYLRETQAEVRPTVAALVRITQGVTPSGGRGDVRAEPVPIRVRLDGQEQSSLPQAVAAVVGSAKAVKIAMDMLETRTGDIIWVSATEEYQVITEPDPDRWRTAQIVWTKRVKSPAR